MKGVRYYLWRFFSRPASAVVAGVIQEMESPKRQASQLASSQQHSTQSLQQTEKQEQQTQSSLSQQTQQQQSSSQQSQQPPSKRPKPSPRYSLRTPSHLSSTPTPASPTTSPTSQILRADVAASLADVVPAPQRLLATIPAALDLWSAQRHLLALYASLVDQFVGSHSPREIFLALWSEDWRNSEVHRQLRRQLLRSPESERVETTLALCEGFLQVDERDGCQVDLRRRAWGEKERVPAESRRGAWGDGGDLA